MVTHMRTIILAGGRGTRLRPFTNAIPKPLVPLGDKPILEIVLRQLSRHGITRVTLAVNHLASLIMSFFGNGENMGMEIDYSLEEYPLGTAGPLSLIKGLDEPFIVMNGDLLSTIDYTDLVSFHEQERAAITVGTFVKEIKIDLGVLKTNGCELVDYVEKPTYTFDVSMGIYVMNQDVVSLIDTGQHMDLPELVMKAKRRGSRVVCYRGTFDWLDIGRLEDYEKAVEVFEKNRARYLPDA